MNVKRITLNSQIKFDFFHFQKYNNTNSNIFTSKYIPSLANSSISLISFDDSFKNIYDSYGVTETATGYAFSIYREDKTAENDSLTFVTKLTEGELSVVDHNVSNNKEYVYHVYKEDENYTSEEVLSNSIDTCWWNWSITGFNIDENGSYKVDKDNIWLLSLNLESGAMTAVMSKTVNENLTRYPKLSTGNTNYKQGSVSCIIGSIQNDKYTELTNVVEKWSTFCSSNELKLLKDRKGNKWIIDVISSSIKIADESVEQYSTVTFEWVELMNSDEISIIE